MKKYLLSLITCLMLTMTAMAANKVFGKVDAAQKIMVNGVERQYWPDIFAVFGSISGFPINEFHLHHVSPRLCQ